jgi:hypothetical protein
MTRTDEDLPADEVTETHAERPLPMVVLGVLVRAIARLWVISLLLATAAFSGIAVYQLFETRAELAELRKSPGPDAYAIVAYRRELERQIRANDQRWREEAVPAPPPRPRLLEEIDLARYREPQRARTTTTLAPISAPQ